MDQGCYYEFIYTFQYILKESMQLKDANERHENDNNDIIQIGIILILNKISNLFQSQYESTSDYFTFKNKNV